VGGLKIAKDGLDDVIKKLVDVPDRNASNTKPLSLEVGSFALVRLFVVEGAVDLDC